MKITGILDCATDLGQLLGAVAGGKRSFVCELREATEAIGTIELTGDRITAATYTVEVRGKRRRFEDGVALEVLTRDRAWDPIGVVITEAAGNVVTAANDNTISIPITVFVLKAAYAKDDEGAK